MSKIILTEGVAASTPTTGTVALYSKVDKKIYFKDDTGTESELSSLLNVVEDTTPQLGGNLDVTNFGLVEDGNVILSFASGGETAVNNIEIVHETTGNAPIIRVVGSDTNVNLDISAKGTGIINLTNPLSVTGSPLLALDTIVDGGFAIPPIAPGPPSFVDVPFGAPAPTAVPGDSVVLGFLAPPPPGLMFNAFISAPTTITVRVADVTGAGFPGGPQPLKATVMSF